ncbi:hypothetical protein BGX33_012624 [Mortierella sp. NVP41]|nr:hypothetical protein BGX33_012624 [Mortierella sp. NVP41]
MREGSCRFDYCKNNLLDREYSDLNRAGKDHVRRYHRHKTHIIVVKDVVFRFRRDPSRNNEYVCVCPKTFSTHSSLELHVLGGERKSYTQAPCRHISNDAIRIARDKDICEDDTKPINYCPSDVIIQRHEQEGMEVVVREPIQLEEIVDGQAEHVDGEPVHVDGEADNVDETNDDLEVLEMKERTLGEAIHVLEQTRNDVRERLRKARIAQK